MMRRVRWRFILLLNTLLACYLYYQNVQSQPGPGSPQSQMELEHHRAGRGVSASKCTRLKKYILHSALKKLKKKVFFETIKELQGCPWVENPTEHKLLQEKFQNCCNASYSMILTQENAPMGHSIRYDLQRRSREVSEVLYNVFPKASPFQKPIRSCAVVGNGGILNNSFCGSEIDRADFVFRFNFPPLNETKDVGSKTDLVYAKPSILINQFSGLQEKRMQFINLVKSYGSSLILLPAFSFVMHTEVSLRALYAVEDFDLESKVVFLNPDYLRNLSNHWRNAGLRFQRLSSGFIMASAAAEVCEKVTLYGFWPFSVDVDGEEITHRYFNNALPKPGVHSLHDEFYWYLKMHVQGSLRLNLGQC